MKPSQSAEKASDRSGARRGGKWVRARIRHATLTRAPMWLSGGRLGRRLHARPLQVTHREIFLPALPPRLNGLRIVHLSDLHLGELTTPADLPAVMDACASLEGDLVAVTGDFIDLKLAAVVSPLVQALRQLAAPLGVHLVLGNHDYLDDGQQLIRHFRAAGLGLLVNQSVSVDRDGVRLTIAGIDYDAKPQRLALMVRHTMLQARDAHPRADLRLLLAHDPDAFDHARRHAVDLTLSGHTHGGQVMLSTRRGKKGSIGLGSLAFRYPRGVYHHGGHALHVTTGVGSWFPLRVQCPAEIACLTLRAGATPPTTAKRRVA